MRLRHSDEISRPFVGMPAGITVDGAPLKQKTAYPFDDPNAFRFFYEPFVFKGTYHAEPAKPVKILDSPFVLSAVRFVSILAAGGFMYGATLFLPKETQNARVVQPEQSARVMQERAQPVNKGCESHRYALVPDKANPYVSNPLAPIDINQNTFFELPCNKKERERYEQNRAPTRSPTLTSQLQAKQFMQAQN